VEGKIQKPKKGGEPLGVNRVEEGSMVAKLLKVLRYREGDWEATLWCSLPAYMGEIFPCLQNKHISLLGEQLTSSWGKEPHEFEEEEREEIPFFLKHEKMGYRVWRVREIFQARDHAVEWLYAQAREARKTIKEVIKINKEMKGKQIYEPEEIEI